MWIKLNVTHIQSREIWVNVDNVNTIVFDKDDNLLVNFVGEDEPYKLDSMTQKQFIAILNDKTKVTFQPDGVSLWDTTE